MKKTMTILLLVIFFGMSAYAQKNLFGIGWDVNFPSNSGYMNKTSYAGGKVEYRHFLSKKFSFGFAMDWATYEQYFPRQTFEQPDGNGAVTGDFIAQIYQLPLTASGHYYFKEISVFTPYAGVSLGGQYMEQSIYYNVYVSDNNNWGFVVRPEIGAIIKPALHGYWGLMFNAGYSYSTNKTEIINSTSFKNITLSLGVIFHD